MGGRGVLAQAKDQFVAAVAAFLNMGKAPRGQRRGDDDLLTTIFGHKYLWMVVFLCGVSWWQIQRMNKQKPELRSRYDGNKFATKMEQEWMDAFGTKSRLEALAKAGNECLDDEPFLGDDGGELKFFKKKGEGDLEPSSTGEEGNQEEEGEGQEHERPVPRRRGNIAGALRSETLAGASD